MKPSTRWPRRLQIQRLLLPQKRPHNISWVKNCARRWTCSPHVNVQSSRGATELVMAGAVPCSSLGENWVSHASVCGRLRAQMGTSLAFHIIFASLGVGLPLLLCLAEGLALWH